MLKVLDPCLEVISRFMTSGGGWQALQTLTLIFSLMLMCKESQGQKDGNAFVQLVNGAPFPMIVLAYHWMLDDLVRFCTTPMEYAILGVDPTFSLEGFEVTVTTYQLTMSDFLIHSLYI